MAASIISLASRTTSSRAFSWSSWRETNPAAPKPARKTTINTRLNLSRSPIVLLLVRCGGFYRPEEFAATGIIHAYVFVQSSLRLPCRRRAPEDGAPVGHRGGVRPG